MKTAVIYYSFEGNCAKTAELLREALKADVYEIKTADTKKRTGFAKYAWGGSQVITRKKPELQPYSIDVNAYDLLILGTPVWAGSPAPAMVSFADKTKIAGKKIALFCCHAGGKGKAMDKFKALFPGNKLAGEIDFVNPASGNAGELKQKIAEWALNLTSS
ncbi:MAG: NAD(P)H-dependent oxidoreductase [Treponema sp.]|jgi:flavodoxin|nr:NAD(P)H-dependent oxidoreductase [Treponema sp.]